MTDIIYKGYDQWWSIRRIAAKTLNMSLEDFMDKKKIPIGARNIICKHIENFIPTVYTNFTEKLDAYLLSEVLKGERCYKRAVEGDEEYVFKSFKRAVRLKNQSDERYNLRLDNAKKKGLLSEDEIKELEDKRKELEEPDANNKED